MQIAIVSAISYVFEHWPDGTFNCRFVFLAMVSYATAAEEFTNRFGPVGHVAPADGSFINLEAASVRNASTIRGRSHVIE